MGLNKYPVQPEIKPDWVILNNILGLTYMYLGQYDHALVNFETALNLAIELGKSKETMIPTLYSNIGAIHQSKQNYEKAMEIFNKSLDISKKLGHRAQTATTLNNMGLVYRKKKDYQLALDNLEQALQIAEHLGDLKNIASRTNNIGLIYFSLRDLPRALDFFTRALEIDVKSGNYANRVNRHTNIGVIYAAFREYEKAINYFNEGILAADKLKLPSEKAEGFSWIARTYERAGDINKSIEYRFLALDIYEKMGLTNEVNRIQGEINKLQGN